MAEQVESKICLTRRLQREGRWEAATSYLDAKREELRAEGMTKKQANAAAWRALAEKFPPLEPELATEPVAARPFPSDDAWVEQNVTLPVVAAAEGEVERWASEFGVTLDDHAAAQLAGGVVARFWAAGLMQEIPQVGYGQAEAVGVG